MSDPLYWDASYAIALALHNRFPEIRLEDVSLEMIFRWTLELPDFADDPQLVNEEILNAIYQDWFEEVHAI
jgi:FeS assembly protein IscX